jgi:DNA-binding response OmpR family regulator
MSVVWIVERNEQTRERLIRLFVENGEEVKGFSFPEEAERAIQHAVPDVLIVECDVGKTEDPLRLTRFALERYSTLPILILSDNRDPDFRRELFELGVADIVYKPYDPVLLRLKVKNLQRIRKGAHPDRSKKPEEEEIDLEGPVLPELATEVPYVRYGRSQAELQDAARAERWRIALERAYQKGAVQKFLAGLWLGCPHCRRPLWGVRWSANDIALASHTALTLRNAFWDWVQSLGGYLSHELPEKRETFEAAEWLCPHCHASFSSIEAGADLLTGYGPFSTKGTTVTELRSILERAGLAVTELPAGKTLEEVLKETRETGQEVLLIRFVTEPHGIDFLKRALAVVSHILKKYTSEGTIFILDPSGQLAVLLPESAEGSGQRLLHQLTYYVRRFGIEKAFRIGRLPFKKP